MNLKEVTQHDIFYNKLIGFEDPRFFINIVRELKDETIDIHVLEKIQDILIQMGARVRGSGGKSKSFIIDNIYVSFGPFSKPPFSPEDYGIIIFVGMLKPNPKELYRIVWKKNKNIATIANQVTGTREDIEL